MCISRSPTWVLAIMTCATIGIVGKIGKRQGMFVELNLPHINDGISAIITINSF